MNEWVWPKIWIFTSGEWLGISTLALAIWCYWPERKNKK